MRGVHAFATHSLPAHAASLRHSSDSKLIRHHTCCCCRPLQDSSRRCSQQHMQHSCLRPQSSPFSQSQVSPNCTVAGQGLTGLCAKASKLLAREWRRGVISMLGPLACLHANKPHGLGTEPRGTVCEATCVGQPEPSRAAVLKRNESWNEPGCAQGASFPALAFIVAYTCLAHV